MCALSRIWLIGLMLLVFWEGSGELRHSEIESVFGVDFRWYGDGGEIFINFNILFRVLAERRKKN